MKMTKVRFVWLTAVLSLTTLGVGAVLAFAQPPGRLDVVLTLQGKVTELTKNDHNDPDGWKLENGQTVHVPPHAFADLKDQIKTGAIVNALTVKKHRPDGSIVNEAIAVDVGDRHVAILPPAPPQHPNKSEIPMKAKGKIVSFHENKHGDTDGFVLSDDTEVKFPPHMGESMTKDLKVGTEVSINGRRHETPKGDVHLHAEEITADGYVYTIDAPKPPKHGPGHEDWMTKRQADEMLSELRAIRKLMEEKTK